ncbi:MAG: sugar ABC transporter substrate-binding protein [Vulcanisaeta sp.]
MIIKRGELGITKQMAAIIALVVIVVVLGALLAYVSVSKPSRVTVTPVTPVVCPAHPNQKLVVYFVTHGTPTDPFWIPVIEGAVYAGQLFNMTVIWEAPSTFSISKMVELAQSALAAKPSGLVISVPEGTAFEPIIQEAYSEGIPVIVINVIPPPGSLPGFPYNETLGYVGQYDYDAGVAAGQYMIQWYEKTYGKPPTNIVIFNHEPGHIGLTLRIEGIENAFKDSGINATINVVPISLNYAESFSIIESYLEAHPNTQLIVTLGPVGTDPAVAAVEDLHLQGKVYIMAFDVDNVTIQGIENGIVIGTVDQQPFAQGFIPVVEMYLYLCYGIVPPYNITTGPFILNKQTISLYQYQLQAVSELSPYLKAITG